MTAPQPDTKPDKIIPFQPEVSKSLNAPEHQKSEEALIGSILINPKAFNTAQMLIGDSSTFFYLKHRHIWEAIDACLERDGVLDLIILSNELQSRGQLDNIGGPASITQIINNTPTSVHFEAYAKLIRRLAQRREFLINIDKARRLVLDESLSLEDVQRQTVDLTTPLQSIDDRPQHIALPIDDHLALTEAAHSSGEIARGIPLGIRNLDTMIDGWHKQRLYVIGGRTGMGKTAFMLTEALHAVMLGKRVLFASLETPTKEIIGRIVAMMIRVKSNHIATGRLNQQEYERYVEAIGRLSKMPLFLDFKDEMSPGELLQRARIIYDEHGLDMIFMDYLNRMRGGPGMENKTRLDYAMKSLVLIAKSKLKIPIVVGAQLNRESVAGKKNKRPQDGSLKGSGNIEEDADCVIYLYRDVVYNEYTQQPDQAELIVSKNRITGELGTVYSKFNYTSKHFTDWPI